MLRKTNAFWPIIVGATSSAFAQANQNAVTDAEDAFGFSNGDENVGIYSEQSVRGFNLESAGNYRINGRYFVKSSGTSNFFLEKKTVRIGYNTFAVDLPGPSGVVDFKLRDPEVSEASLLTTGLAEHGSPYVDFLYKHRSADDHFSAATGLGLQYDNKNYQGGTSSSWLFAGTARWNITDHTKVQFYFGEYSYRRQGKFRIRTDGTFLPAPVKRGNYLGQNWAEEKGERRIVGLTWDHELGADWNLGGIASFSQEDPTMAYTQLFTIKTPGDNAHSALITAPHQKFTAWSGEMTIGRTFRTGSLFHKFNIHTRLRVSRNRFGGETILDLGVNSIAGRQTQIAETANNNRTTIKDEVNQWGLGLAYQLNWANHTNVSAGILRSNYRKSFTSENDSNENINKPWLYNIAVTTKMLPQLELYASYNRGLEEAGTAPSSAANPNEVLNAVIVTQRELGLKAKVANDLNLVIAGFDTRKPNAGLNSDNKYGLFGTVKHRGLEASLSGKIAEGLSIIIGGVLMDASLSNASTQADKPVAVPSHRFIANIDYTFTNWPSLSIDAGIEVIGKQAASSKVSENGQLILPEQTTVNLGLRYKFHLANQPATLRFQAVNLFDKFHWIVNSAETLDYNPARRFRLVLTTEF